MILSAFAETRLNLEWMNELIRINHKSFISKGQNRHYPSLLIFPLVSPLYVFFPLRRFAAHFQTNWAGESLCRRLSLSKHHPSLFPRTIPLFYILTGTGRSPHDTGNLHHHPEKAAVRHSVLTPHLFSHMIVDGIHDKHDGVEHDTKDSML